MIRAFGLPHFGQTSRWGAGTLGVLLRFWRRSAWMVSGCIDVPPIISKSRGCVRRILHTFHNVSRSQLWRGHLVHDTRANCY